MTVSKASYNLHTADGVEAFDAWLDELGVTKANCVKIHITEDEHRQIVIWDETVGAE